MEEYRSVFSLDDKQQKAFKKLERAYKECEKKGIYFVNMYGTLIAYDKNLISDYTDNSTNLGNAFKYISTECRTHSDNSIDIPNEWTDDEHLYGMTKRGYELFLDYDNGEV